ncbi:MAG: hypothetical protein R2867_45880 [Caldilineaceae bacterium]
MSIVVYSVTCDHTGSRPQVAYGSMVVATLINLFIPQIIKRAIDNGLAQRNAIRSFGPAA